MPTWEWDDLTFSFEPSGDRQHIVVEVSELTGESDHRTHINPTLALAEQLAECITEAIAEARREEQT